MSDDELRITISNDIIDSLEKHKEDLIQTHYDEYVNLIVNHAIESMINGVVSKHFDSVIHQLEIQRRSRNRVKKTLKNKGNNQSLLVYNLGKYDGVYSTMVEMIDRIIDQNQVEELYKQLISKKYLVDIIEYLYKNPLVYHKSICEAVGVKPNYLSELMMGLTKNGLINKYSFSKYTNYSLTEKGKLLYEFHLKNTKSNKQHNIKTLKDNEVYFISVVQKPTASFRSGSFELFDGFEQKKKNVNSLYLKNA